MAHLNVNGSDDPCYRYKMPAIRVKHEGTSKMKKTILVNLAAISEKIGRPLEPLLQHLGQALSAACKVEGEGKSARYYISGHHSGAEIQDLVLGFIRSCVLCEHCGNPETTVEVSGTGTRQRAALNCASCPNSTELNLDSRCVKLMVKLMVKHAPSGPVKPSGPEKPGEKPVKPSMTKSRPDAVIELPQKKEKTRCSNCGHKTSKPVCSRCEMTIGGSRPESRPQASSDTARTEEESPSSGEDRRVDPMLDNAEVTYEGMCALYRRQGQGLSDAQMMEHWKNLQPAQEPSGTLHQ